MKSEFEKWYRDKYQITKPLYFFEDNQRYEDGFTQDAWEVWQHQQSKVDELTKQRDSFIKAYEIEVDKSVELQKRVSGLTQVVEELLEEMKYPTATFEEVICSGVRELEQALKGDQ